MQTIFSGSVPVESAATWLATLENALAMPPDRMPAFPGVMMVLPDGTPKPIGGFAYSQITAFALGRWIISQVAARLPHDITKAASEKLAKIAIRASTTYNLQTALVAPGAVSAATTLTLDSDVAGALLLDTVVDPYDAQVFNLPVCTIGVSQLVSTTQVLNPASALAGLAPGIWQSDGAEYNDLSPEYGIVYRTRNGQPIVITVTAAHKREFGTLAAATRFSMSFLCLVDQTPQCSGPSIGDVAEIFAQYGVCKV